MDAASTGFWYRNRMPKLLWREDIMSKGVSPHRRQTTDPSISVTGLLSTVQHRQVDEVRVY